MNARLHGFVLVLVLAALCAAAPARQSGDAAIDRTQAVGGEVTLFRESSGEPVKDASRVLLWLVPKGADPRVQSRAEKPVYRMVQHHKTFEPHLLVVPLGSAVSFPNLDPWFHSVFSLYRGKRFDLGLYEPGSHKTIVFDRPGASYVFCNIHPQMAAVILTVDSDYFGISDKNGRVSIADVPTGPYELHVWYEDATEKSLEALERPILVRNAGHSIPLVSIAVTKQDLIHHKNKYGRDYDPQASSPEY
jgi:plastocyanin